MKNATIHKNMTKEKLYANILKIRKEEFILKKWDYETMKLLTDLEQEKKINLQFMNEDVKITLIDEVDILGYKEERYNKILDHIKENHPNTVTPSGMSKKLDIPITEVRTTLQVLRKNNVLKYGTCELNLEIENKIEKIEQKEEVKNISSFEECLKDIGYKAPLEIKKIEEVKKMGTVTQIKSAMLSELHTEQKALFEVKNIKYDDSFGKTFKEYGNAVLCIRLDDKLQRIKSLLLKGQEGTQDESILDTLQDLANYANMAIIELKLKKDEEIERRR